MCSINPTFRRPSQHKTGWVSHGHFTLNQGPVILMIENYRTGLIWRLMRRCPFIVNGLRRAGFEGGWLGTPVASREIRPTTKAAKRGGAMGPRKRSGSSGARGPREK